jgi:hypothetical protein
MSNNDTPNPKGAVQQGWLPEDTSEEFGIKKAPEDHESMVASALPAVTSKAEKLIASLKENCDIVVHEAHLTTDHNCIFHLFLAISDEDYHSPKLQRANILVEKYAQINEEYAIHITFITGDGSGIDLLSTDSHKLKYINFNPPNKVN